MDYNYLIETKNEFLNTVINILTPQIYNGLITMYDHSMNVFSQLKKKIETNPKNISPQIVNYFKLKTNDYSKMTVEEVENEYNKIKIEIFKKYVNDIASKNNTEIDGEYQRIKSESRFADIFDSLIRACFKSYLLFFTFDPKTKNSKFNDPKYYENINIRDFIHKCYVETCTFFLNNPELFIKRNRKTEINEHIKTCIIMSIRKSLPYNEMVNEYLRIDLDMKQNKNDEIQKMEKLINNIMEKNKSKHIIDENDDDDKYLKIDKIINENKDKQIIKSDKETEGDLYEDIERERNEIKNKKNIKTNIIEKYEVIKEKTDELNNKENSDMIVEDITNDDNETSKYGGSKENSDINSPTENVEEEEEDEDNDDKEMSETSVETDKEEVNKSQSVINSLMSVPKRKERISKIKNNIDKNMEKFYNDLII